MIFRTPLKKELPPSAVCVTDGPTGCNRQNPWEIRTAIPQVVKKSQVIKNFHDSIHNSQPLALFTTASHLPLSFMTVFTTASHLPLSFMTVFTTANHLPLSFMTLFTFYSTSDVFKVCSWRWNYNWKGSLNLTRDAKMSVRRLRCRQ